MHPHTKTYFTEIRLLSQHIVNTLFQHKIQIVCPCVDEETFIIKAKRSQEKELTIKVIQIQKVIVFYLVEDDLLVDSFWINWTNYIKKKLFNTYILKDLKTTQLKPLTNRIMKNLQTKSDIFLRVIYNNLVLFNKFLTHKQFKNLATSSSTMYRAINQQAQYKMLYEERWGRSGFELEEKNWIVAYRKKCINK